MTALRALPRRVNLAEVLPAVAGAAVVLAATLRLGPAGLLVPLGALAALALLQRPGVALAVFAAVVTLAEGRDPGLLPGLTVVHEPLAFGVAPVDLLAVVVVAAVALDLLRRREVVRLPALLALPLALLALAAAAGAVTGYARGSGVADVAFAGRQLPYLVLMPLLVVNVVHTRRAVLVALATGAGLAIVKAVLGLAAVLAGRGTTVDASVITYYEPAANWLMLAVLLGVLAAMLHGARDRLPWWLLAGSPLMLASLALSLRRSFWIGIVLGGLLVVLLAASPAGRRLLVPAVTLAVVGAWLLGAVGFQVQGPLTTRVESLNPSRVEVNAEDRYRFDERANVIAELGAHPVTGLGLAVEWSSAARPLPVEHENGRQYVHMVALWYWLKLGLLGLAAYVALIIAACILAWRVWRAHPDRLLQAGGLAAIAGLVAMAAVETAGSFTGVDPRFTILFGIFLGLLAVAYRETRES
jgi:O-Antigen ligase